MSHFGVLVLADEPLDRADAAAYCERVLERYDENRTVDEHEIDCYCVGYDARRAAESEVDARYADDVERRRDEFRQLRAEVIAAGHGEVGERDLPIFGSGATAVLPESKRRDELAERERVMDAEWEAMNANRTAEIKIGEREHPAYGKPDAACDECGGTGRKRTTRNPEGFWDWWVIGGRWTGVLDPDYDPGADPRNFGTCKLCDGTGTRPDADRFGEEWLKWSGGCNGCEGTGIERSWHNAPHDSDVLPLADVSESVTVENHFYAIVTPDGVWHQRGRMGWFGISHDDMDEPTWRAYALWLIDSCRDATAIVVDCHV